MKATITLSVTAVSLITGTLLSYGGNSAIWQYVASSKALPLAISLGMAFIAYRDYLRKPRTIKLPTSQRPTALRPMLPAENSKTYSIRRQRALIERAAA